MSRAICITALAALIVGLVGISSSTRAGSIRRSDLPPPQETVSSTDTPLLGVVWTPPDAPGPALRALNRIHAAGATAVRLTTLPAADTVFARADTLGLRLFVDLPVSYVSARALRDAVEEARPELDRLRSLAQRHAAVQYVGLARHADTTVPAACSVLDEWTSRLNDDRPALRTYYVTPFTAPADRCAGAVNLVLPDMRARPAPVEQWQRWHGGAAAVGLGALGTWVHSGAETGLRVPHSAERQARYLERTLSHLLDASQPSPHAVFAYRWRDRPAPPLSSRRYGLQDTSGTRRPAADVVAGIYTGTQRVFAFPSGTAPPTTPHGLLLFGWGLIVLLAGLYALRPFVRRTAFRYFAAHGFYWDALREGRNVAPGVNAVLLLLVATALGIIATVLARIAAARPTTEHVVAVLPAPLHAPLGAGLAEPVLAGCVAGGLTLALLGGWTAGLTAAPRSDARLSLGQALMLVVWPCWPVIPGMVAALVTAAQPPASPNLLGSLLFGGGLVGSVAVTGRVLRDYWALTDGPGPVSIVLVSLSPPALLFLITLLVILQYDIPLSLLWHLLTRT